MFLPDDERRLRNMVGSDALKNDQELKSTYSQMLRWHHLAIGGQSQAELGPLGLALLLTLLRRDAEIPQPRTALDWRDIPPGTRVAVRVTTAALDKNKNPIVEEKTGVLASTSGFGVIVKLDENGKQRDFRARDVRVIGMPTPVAYDPNADLGGGSDKEGLDEGDLGEDEDPDDDEIVEDEATGGEAPKPSPDETADGSLASPRGRRRGPRPLPTS